MLGRLFPRQGKFEMYDLPFLESKHQIYLQVNAIYALGAAGCSTDVFHCEHNNGCDDEEVCNVVNGNCFDSCNGSSTSACEDPNHVCMNGMCREEDDTDEEPVPFADQAYFLSQLCANNDEGDVSILLCTCL